MFDYLNNAHPEYLDLALLIARVIAGWVMIYYGAPKIRNLTKNAQDFVHMGFVPGWLWGTIVAFVEFFGGVLLIAGFFVPAIAAMFGFQMILGTIWKISATKKRFPDWSYDLILLALMLLLIAAGPGAHIFCRARCVRGSDSGAGQAHGDRA